KADLAGRASDVLPVADRAGEDLRDLVLRQRLDRVARRDGDGRTARADRQRHNLTGRLFGVGEITADVAEVGLTGDHEVHTGVRADVGQPLPGDVRMHLHERVGERLHVVERAATAV